MWQPLLRAVVPKKPVVHAVHLRGAITSRAGPRGISFEQAKPLLDAAFKGSPHPPAAVALVIDSPGGSATVSNLIGSYIDDKASTTKIPVLSFATDVAASGGYWLLCAGQEIYADESSIVGSIGVISGSFGLHKLIERYGVERRTQTAGVHKLRLDPFLPQAPADVEKLKDTLERIHEVFKAHVRQKRGAKIEGKEDVVFSGDFFVGRDAVEKGLVDAIGNLHSVAKQKFGPGVVVRDLKPRPPFPFLPSWLGGGGSSGGGGSLSADVVAHVADELEARVEERLWRARVGL